MGLGQKFKVEGSYAGSNLGIDPGLRELVVSLHLGELGQLSHEGREVEERRHRGEPELLENVQGGKH